MGAGGRRPGPPLGAAALGMTVSGQSRQPPRGWKAAVISQQAAQARRSAGTGCGCRAGRLADAVEGTAVTVLQLVPPALLKGGVFWGGRGGMLRATTLKRQRQDRMGLQRASSDLNSAKDGPSPPGGCPAHMPATCPKAAGTQLPPTATPARHASLTWGCSVHECRGSKAQNDPRRIRDEKRQEAPQHRHQPHRDDSEARSVRHTPVGGPASE